MITSPSHTLVVTALDPERENPEYKVICNRPSFVWWECTRPWCVVLDPEYDEEDEFNRHGMHHERIESGYGHMIQSDSCICELNDESGRIREMAEEFGVGNHSLAVDYEGDGEWYWIGEAHGQERVSDHQ